MHSLFWQVHLEVYIVKYFISCYPSLSSFCSDFLGWSTRTLSLRVLNVKPEDAKERPSPKYGFIWGYVHFMCYWFCFDSITQGIRSAESRPRLVHSPRFILRAELCVEALKERVNEVKINEARERHHLKAVCPSMPHL